MFQEDDILQWAQNRHNQLLPLVILPPSAPPQPVGCSANETKATVQEPLKKKKAADSETKGCRKMRLREYRTYLAVARMPEETTREQAPEFVREWETIVATKPPYKRW